jgi:hypothetical protein
MVDDQTVESELGQVSRSKELVVDSVTRGNTGASPAQKLPRTAICCHFEAAKPLFPFQPAISLPFQRVPASLGPGPRTVSGATRSLGGTLPIECPVCHDWSIDQQKRSA